MCNLYSVKTRRADLARKFRLSDNRMAAFDALPAIFPGHTAPIIKQSQDGVRELALRSWGFVLLRQGYAPKRVSNARDDKIQTAFWKDSFEKRRWCRPPPFASPTKARGQLALVRAEARRRTAALCLSRHPPPMERANQERRAQCLIS